MGPAALSDPGVQNPRTTEEPMSWRPYPLQPQARHAATAQAEGRFLHSQVSWTDERAPARNAC